MKKPIPPVAIAIAAVAVVVLGLFAFIQMSKDPVQTGTKTGYSPNDMPPPPTFTIPPAPESAGVTQGGAPPPADAMRGR